MLKKFIKSIKSNMKTIITVLTLSMTFMLTIVISNKMVGKKNDSRCKL